MNIGLIFAMKEEATVLDSLFPQHTTVNHDFYTITTYDYNNITFTAIISNIGKAFAASATTLLIEKFNVDAVINIGSCGGINCKVGDVILSNQSLYHDVDVTGFGYEKGVIPQQELIYKANESIFNLNNLLTSFNNEETPQTGIIATGDQFINNLDTVKNIHSMNNDIRALEMEAAAIAQVCKSYNKDFLLIKKVSDLADNNADSSFKGEIVNFDKKIITIIENIIKQIK